MIKEINIHKDEFGDEFLSWMGSDIEVIGEVKQEIQDYLEHIKYDN